MTGVVNSVSIWLTISPPTIVMPSGWRNSAPMPQPNISGSAASSADIVVIRIGRKRSRHARRIASRGAIPSLRSASSAKSIIMIAFFLTMPISRMMPMIAMIEEILAGEHQREQRANPRRRQRRQDRHRMDVALVEHAQHDVHRDDRREDQPHFVRERGAEGECRALEPDLHRGRHAELALDAFDRADGVAERCAPRQIERDSRRGKLADAIDGELGRALDHPGDRRQRNLLRLLPAGGAAAACCRHRRHARNRRAAAAPDGGAGT